MQGELHFDLTVLGSSPGRASIGALAQLVEHQTPFAGDVSPILVAAVPKSTSVWAISALHELEHRLSRVLH